LPGRTPPLVRSRRDLTLRRGSAGVRALYAAPGLRAKRTKQLLLKKVTNVDLGEALTSFVRV